jgi:hypothetical protein
MPDKFQLQKMIIALENENLRDDLREPKKGENRVMIQHYKNLIRQAEENEVTQLDAIQDLNARIKGSKYDPNKSKN